MTVRISPCVGGFEAPPRPPIEPGFPAKSIPDPEPARCGNLS